MLFRVSSLNQSRSLYGAARRLRVTSRMKPNTAAPPHAVRKTENTVVAVAVVFSYMLR